MSSEESRNGVDGKLLPTPRTDALLDKIGEPNYDKSWDNNIVYFARELERELALSEAAPAREAVLEEAAKVCDREAAKYQQENWVSSACRGVAANCAEAIRALSSPAQGEQPQDFGSIDKRDGFGLAGLSTRHPAPNAAEPAVPNGVYKELVLSPAAPLAPLAVSEKALRHAINILLNLQDHNPKEGDAQYARWICALEVKRLDAALRKEKG